MIYMEPKS